MPPTHSSLVAGSRAHRTVSNHKFSSNRRFKHLAQQKLCPAAIYPDSSGRPDFAWAHLSVCEDMAVLSYRMDVRTRWTP